MNRRKIIIILMLLISLFSIRPVIKVKAIDSVVGHYVIEKQISLYSDDAFLFVNSYFTNSTTAIPLNNNQYDIMIGLRFQDVGLNARTSTTYETIETCRLSFYTTDDYPVESGDTWLTIYGIKEVGDVPTFTSYQDMIDRELYPVHNNVNFNELIGDGEWWNTTDIRVTTRNLINGTERDIGFILYASSGGASRLFRTYEHNSSLAVKLYVMVFQWEIYDPTEQDDYVETYRGYDIFGECIRTVDNVGYTEMTQKGDPNKIYVVDDTLFNWTNILKSTPSVALGFDVNLTEKEYVNNMEANFNFTVRVIYDDDAQPNPIAFFLMGELHIIGTVYECYADNELLLFDVRTVSNYLYEFLPRKYGTSPATGNYSDSLTENTWYKGKVILEDTLWRLEVSNVTTGDMVTSCQVIIPFVHNITSIMPLAGQHSTGNSAMSGWMSKTNISDVYDYWVEDENGTKISPDLPSVEDCEGWIDNYLSHSGGGIGEGMGDLVIALMGLAGFIMIPLSLIIFIQNMQSGDVENAFYMLMVLFFMGIAFIANWLWG